MTRSHIHFRFSFTLLLAFVSLMATAQTPVRQKCGTRSPEWLPGKFAVSDCDGGQTIINGTYDDGGIFNIPVVFHILHRTNGEGKISEQKVAEQIQILNEDFRALAGTPAAGGFDTGITFFLADRDPAGESSSGITYTANDRWFDDATLDVRAEFGAALAWDTTRYLNVFVNSGGGAAGYVVNMPWMTGANPAEEGIVVAHDLIGYTPSVPDFDLGRTATHEVGHYLGLEHTFEAEGSCESGDCYRSGDLICDTEPHRNANDSCNSNSASCGSSDPIHNYMNYTPDSCMNQFTREQANRMRCSIMTYRASLLNNSGPDPVTGSVEKRWIPHLTKPGAGFRTNLLISNQASASQDVVLRAYNRDGDVIAERSVSVAASGFTTLDAGVTFGDEASHLAIEGSDSCTISAAYRADHGDGATAHVNEMEATGLRYQFFAGEQLLVFDGLAIVNVGSEPSSLTIRLRDDAGRSLSSQVLTDGLAVKGKYLTTLDGLFTDLETGILEIESDQPFLLLNLRGSLAGAQPAYLFQTFPIRAD